MSSSFSTGTVRDALPMPVLLDESKAADVLNCSVAWLRKKRLLGGGPPYTHLGRLIRYSVADLQAYINANTVTARAAEVRNAA